MPRVEEMSKEELRTAEEIVRKDKDAVQKKINEMKIFQEKLRLDLISPLEDSLTWARTPAERHLVYKEIVQQLAQLDTVQEARDRLEHSLQILDERLAEIRNREFKLILEMK